MGFTGPEPCDRACGSAPTSAQGLEHGAPRFAVVQQRGRPTSRELGRYHDKSVAHAALEEMVAEGLPARGARRPEDQGLSRMSGTGGGNVPWPAFKGVISGSQDQARTVSHYAVDRRHENGAHWIELGVFPSRFLAQEALDASRRRDR